MDIDVVLKYLAIARQHHTQAEIAKYLEVDVKTIRRWEAGESKPKPYTAHALRQLILPFGATDTENAAFVGFRDETAASAFNFDAVPLQPKGKVVMRDILHKTDGSEPRIEADGDKYFNHDLVCVPAKYTLTDKLWAYLQNYAAKHKAAGNGFGFVLAYPDSVSRTLSARCYKDGSEILV